MLRASFVLALVSMSGCSKSVNDCEGAIARLARIDANKGRPAMSKQTSNAMLEACRTAAPSDPVVRCLMDSSTDDKAGECIDRGMAESVHVSGDAGPGSGLNPLLP